MTNNLLFVFDILEFKFDVLDVERGRVIVDVCPPEVKGHPFKQELEFLVVTWR